MNSPKLRDVPVSILIVDADVQRRLDLRRVSRMVADFQPQALGTITVSRRDASGAYHIIDGQHRVMAAREARGEMFAMSARVFESLSIREEAELFRLLNETAKPTAFDGFRVRVVEGEHAAVHITDILKRHGFILSRGTQDGAFCAVTAGERIFRLDPNALERTLGTVVHAWGRTASAVDSRIIDGLGSVWHRYGDAIDGESLATKLARTGTPDTLVGHARTLAKALSSSMTSAMAELVVNTYNKGRTTRALPPWRNS